MYTQSNYHHIPESVLRRDNGVWRNEAYRRALAADQAAAQLALPHHHHIAVACLLTEAARFDHRVAGDAEFANRKHLWRDLSDAVLTPNNSPTAAYAALRSHNTNVSSHFDAEQQQQHQRRQPPMPVCSPASDDYQGTVTKLSSMMLWEAQRRRYAFSYYEDELYARRVTQMRTLHTLEAQIERGGSPFFIEPPPSAASSASPLGATTATTTPMSDGAAATDRDGDDGHGHDNDRERYDVDLESDRRDNADADNCDEQLETAADDVADVNDDFEQGDTADDDENESAAPHPCDDASVDTSTTTADRAESCTTSPAMTYGPTPLRRASTRGDGGGDGGGGAGGGSSCRLLPSAAAAAGVAGGSHADPSAMLMSSCNAVGESRGAFDCFGESPLARTSVGAGDGSARQLCLSPIRADDDGEFAAPALSS